MSFIELIRPAGIITTPKPLAFTVHYRNSQIQCAGGKTMNPTLCFFMFVALIACGRVLAKEEVLATITNDQTQGVYKFIAETDDETNAIKTLYKDVSGSGKVEREVLDTQELNQSGVVLEKRGSREIINLKSDNFDADNGGRVTIDTLYNGLSGERKEYDLELAKSEDGWKLFKGEKAITKLHIITNKKVFVGAIGVKDIEMK
jgi:hypothetical protein